MLIILLLTMFCFISRFFLCSPYEWQRGYCCVPTLASDNNDEDEEMTMNLLLLLSFLARVCVHVESSKFCKKDMKHALVLWYYCSSAPHSNEQAFWILSLLKNTHNALSLLSSQLALFILYPFKAQTPGECIHLYNHVLTRERLRKRFILEFCLSGIFVGSALFEQVNYLNFELNFLVLVGIWKAKDVIGRIHLLS